MSTSFLAQLSSFSVEVVGIETSDCGGIAAGRFSGFDQASKVLMRGKEEAEMAVY